MNFSFGVTYSIGNLSPYIVSYIRARSAPSTLHYTDATFLFAGQIIGDGISIVFGGIFERKFGPRLVSLFGGWFMSL